MNLKSIIEIKEVLKSACKKNLKWDDSEKSTAVLFLPILSLEFLPCTKVIV